MYIFQTSKIKANVMDKYKNVYKKHDIHYYDYTYGNGHMIYMCKTYTLDLLKLERKYPLSAVVFILSF